MVGSFWGGASVQFYENIGGNQSFLTHVGLCFVVQIDQDL